MNANDRDQTTKGARKAWVKPAVVADKAAHAEGHTPRHFNNDGQIICSS